MNVLPHHYQLKHMMHALLLEKHAEQKEKDSADVVAQYLSHCLPKISCQCFLQSLAPRARMCYQLYHYCIGEGKGKILKSVICRGT